MVANNDNTEQAIQVQAKRKAKQSVLDKVMAGNDVARKLRLTRKERAVLEVVSDPTLFKATATERIAAAGVSPPTYYKVLKDPRFKELQENFVHVMLRERIGPIIGAAIDTATQKGREGHQDRAMVLQMAGLHTPRKHIEQHVTGAVAIGIVGIDIDDA